MESSKFDHGSHYEHEAILRELRAISQQQNTLIDTMRDGFEIYRTETQQRHSEVLAKFDEVWKHISEEKRRTDRALAIAEQTRGVLWYVGGAILTANLSALAKLIGLW